jgi:hypothetical protein
MNDIIDDLNRRLLELERRETIIVLYTYRYDKGWQVEAMDHIIITDTTWPRWHDAGDSQSGPDPDMAIGIAHIGRLASEVQKWEGHCNTPWGSNVTTYHFKTRDECLAGLRKLLNDDGEYHRRHRGS